MIKHSAHLRPQPTAALLLLGLATAACSSGTAGGEQQAGSVPLARLSVNGIHFEGSHIGPTAMRNGRLRTSLSGHALSLEQHKLRVDGREYGTLRPGNTVTVTDSGTVLINGQPARHE